MDIISTGILDVKYFDPEVQRVLLNSTHGLRMATNNKGTIVGNEIRFPLTDVDGIAAEVNSGAPIVPDQLVAETSTAIIKTYEASTSLNPENLNATNSAASLRASAAYSVVHKMENRFSFTILEALAQYDDVDMEVGDNTTAFDVDMISEIDLLADNHGWGQGDKFMLLPPEAMYTLKQDAKFMEIFSIVHGSGVIDAYKKPSDMDDGIKWVPYRGYNIGVMQKKSGNNAVGLPIADDGAILGFAWKRSRVGFGMNENLSSRIFQDETKQGNPIIFKSNGSCGSTIIDSEGVIGIKLDPTPATA